MESLILSLVALALGPVLLTILHARGALLEALDGFVLFVITGLVLFHILPHGIEHAGWAALIAAGIGLGGPLLIERLRDRSAEQAHSAALVLAVIGLVLHGGMDGIALGAQVGESKVLADPISLAVILHRVPDGIAAWWVLRSSRGAKTAIGVLVLVAFFTVLGFRFGARIQTTQSFSHSLLGLFQALVAGSLLHVIVHEPTPRKHPTHGRRATYPAAAGALFGALVVFAIAALSREPGTVVGLPSSGTLFVAIAARAAPYVLFAVLLSMRWPRQSDPTLAWFFVLALFRVEFAMLYGVAQAAQAGLSGAWKLPHKPAARRSTAKGDERAALHARAKDAGLRAKDAVLAFAEGGGPWLVGGIAFAAVMEPLIPNELWSMSLPPAILVLLIATPALVVRIPVLAAAPIAFLWIHKGASPGAALAFLLVAPALSLRSAIVARKHAGNWKEMGGVLLTFASAVTIGFCANWVMASALPVDAHALAMQPLTDFQTMSLVILGALLFLGLARVGPRAMLARVFPGADAHRHDLRDEDHSEHHGDDHDPVSGLSLRKFSELASTSRRHV